MDRSVTGETDIHIHDRAKRLVEGMRQAEETRSVNQRKAAELISEQMDRLAVSEAEAADLRTVRAVLEDRVRVQSEASEAAEAAHAAEVARMAAEHGARVEEIAASASKEIDRLREWVKEFKAQMGEKQASLERDNSRLVLESERLSEENAALVQTAESLLSAIEDQAAALQRQDALVAEAMRREPVRQRTEGSVIRMPPRPRPEASEPGERAPGSESAVA
jgi:hypothetical protein